MPLTTVAKVPVDSSNFSWVIVPISLMGHSTVFMGHRPVFVSWVKILFFMGHRDATRRFHLRVFPCHPLQPLHVVDFTAVILEEPPMQCKKVWEIGLKEQKPLSGGKGRGKLT